MSRIHGANLFSVVALVAIAAALAVWRFAFVPTLQEDASDIEVVVPAFTAEARAGEAAFDENCASCHGLNASGTDKGPPLVHDIYNPGHHGDAAFALAAMRGVRAHHWRFGDMPPQPQVSRDEIEKIVAYVRELQAANGIRYREHKM